MKDWKKQPWRIVVFCISLAVIIFLWVKKDIAAIYASAPQEQILPMMVTSVMVSLIKVGLIAAAVFLVKWLVDKNKKNK